MNCKLEELKGLMPDAIRDVDYFNHIVIHQNDEIIRLLKKIAKEEDEVLFVAPLSIEQEEAEIVQTRNLPEEKVVLAIQKELPKAKRKKKEV